MTDDTRAFQEAIDKYDNIYVPSGWYRISETLKMREGTALIGLHPFATQLRLAESEASFSGFGPPRATIESSRGGANILNGIGINTGGYNYRAVGVKWLAGEASYMNDVKFVGGHGSMGKPARVSPSPAQRPGNSYQQGRVSSPYNPVSAQGMDLAWDNQYWSLWITDNGGGRFKDIWSASTYAAAGLYINNTSTPGRIYAMSLEHHVRNEARLKNVSAWKIYALQFEEESRESRSCQPLEIENCSDLMIANLYTFRVIRVDTPYPYAIRAWNCNNVEIINAHNYAQTIYTATNLLYDINKDIEVRPWDLERLLISGGEKGQLPITSGKEGAIEKLASGFEFAQGITHDNRGNIYFCEPRLRRIYKWSVETSSLSMIADFPWKPYNLAFDSEDNLLVSFRYDPQPGYAPGGIKESFPPLPDAAGTSYGGYGNSSSPTMFYSIDPNNPEETIKPLPLLPMKGIKDVHKALYPSGRRRDRLHDFNAVAIYVPDKCFVAPDGKTIIPQYFDLARSGSLTEAYPGKTVYVSDEYRKRTVRMDVGADGTLSGLSYFVEWGEFASALDNRGNVYVADGQVYVFGKDGKEKDIITVPERPTTLTFGGKDNDILFITTRSALYGVRIR
jgi:sugar lactone lactonase YvrE